VNKAGRARVAMEAGCRVVPRDELYLGDDMEASCGNRLQKLASLAQGILGGWVGNAGMRPSTTEDELKKKVLEGRRGRSSFGNGRRMIWKKD